MASITCEQCGTQRHRCPSNTKLCRPCATLRDAVYSAGWAPRECNQRDCDNVFAPLSRSDRTCGDCSFSLHRGRCNWCDEPEAELLKQDLAICMKCAKDPEVRGRFIKALRQRQRKTREANGWEAPE